MQVVNGGSGPVPPLPSENHECPDCGFTYPLVSVSDSCADVEQVPSGVRRAIAGMTSEVLRARPSFRGWSTTEYICHLRDIYATSTLRVHYAKVAEHAAVEPMFNNIRAQRFRYNDRDVATVVAELDDNVHGFLEVVATVQDADWERTLERLPGEIRTIRWLVRNAAHEGVHHVRDIERIIADLRRGVQ